ncbi:MAG: peptide chain release factor N(5)-glutamine methyltransferase [Gemmatimonadetes bacterium]|uniref:Release factor glutamine methyltransferase n=1 Tax=Candidatus Kutchimonas denitrificans TaxID=3056748 RepID=A0AAE4Z5W8_9BACT|nr:peptide chain release factor N(5)-glutamine methyltransferase [Gemmatimonadota bacterium]NIR73939.1 peptide chain release factor N(5)-glutamine methyltransferase [Candidatus Kutchimonas denitrificans]NIR99745.1 peptide chain release factor N(5)-glutamine methyltransferase [Gemmatimonadota bacterium]NIT65330.1 peptide chain release factor N(5)-glutamine methyltransferase [Gemmatimonadota bacterium]NIW73779.1 peptide chain release factor N(5)-glutamine methyltransferase [Gemmatimonadota bacter
MGTAKPITVLRALEIGWRTLAAVRHDDDARREARFLLAGVLGLEPGALALERDRVLTTVERNTLAARLARRVAGEPLQYIEGRAAFRQLDLRVGPSVLIPRPETEQLVGFILDWCQGRNDLQALDLGTGSGAIAISLAVEGPFHRVVGVDISASALNFARYNAKEAEVADRVDLRSGSLYSAVRPGERFHVVVSNPPYVASGETASLPPEVRDWEPAIALFAGPTGLELIEAIVDGAPAHLEPGGLLALEVAPGIVESALARIRANGDFAEPELHTDYAEHPRIVLAERHG